MQKMFQSATLKLTAWYLAIIMAVSITFSIVIYQINYHQISYRLESLQHSIFDDVNAPLSLEDYLQTINLKGPNSFLEAEARKASSEMILSLVYINIVVFMAGGLGAYLLARRTLEPLEEAHESQSRFTSDASHELRTPLAAMRAELEVTLRDPKLDVNEARDTLESNLEEVNKLIRLSEMLLHLSRLDHGKLEVRSVDISRLAQGVLKLHSNEKKRFKLTLRKKVMTRANESSIEELISILVENALKYSPASSPIHIRTFTQRGYVGFEIKNEGEKIPEKVLPRLFDRFFRADTSRTNGSKNGYGLGLSIAKKVVDIHHGEITVSSTDDETVFTFFLPIVKSNYSAQT